MYSALFPTLSRRMYNQLPQQIPNIWTYLICEERWDKTGLCDIEF